MGKDRLMRSRSAWILPRLLVREINRPSPCLDSNWGALSEGQPAYKLKPGKVSLPTATLPHSNTPSKGGLLWSTSSSA